MKLYVELTHCEYDLNYREARMALRQHLADLGFFNYPEHAGMWELIEKKEAEGDEVESFIKAIVLFNAVKLGQTKKAD